ncbi:MAG: hypothetical protein Q8N17_26095 [Burkholderiaceae bacterium]|nr:hypothetical protein [Burkholderiaceae bacterium]
MNQEVQQLEGRLVVAGQFECRDKDGVLLKTIDFKCEVPLNQQEEDHGDQRSE